MNRLLLRPLRYPSMRIGSATSCGAADVRPSLVIATGIIILLAGMTFTGAVEDALTGYYLTATARLLEVGVLTGGIIAGRGEQIVAELRELHEARPQHGWDATLSRLQDAGVL